jgi:GAF domain-containing protein
MCWLPGNECSFRPVHVPDVQSDPEYAYAARDVDLIRTMLAVPLLRGNDLLGTITIYKLEVKPFTDSQIALVEDLRRPSCHRHREHASV